MVKIAFFEIEDWEIDYIKQKFPGDSMKFFKEPLTMQNVDQVADFDAIAVFIYSFISFEILDKLRNVKLITTMSTGFDHINLEECKKRNIIVCNVPTYGENTVAEHAFALILAISRKLVPSIERTRRGNFELEGLRGFDLKEKTIGVIGCGNIGKNVIRMAKGFQMNVLVFDVKKDEQFAKDMGFSYVEMNYLLSKSDIITLHAPYNKYTHHMINKDNIKQIKKGAVLINTARGGLVETDAIIEALGQKILSAAGLDVLEDECFIKEEKQLLSKQFPGTCDLKTVLQEHILLDQENVLITPHNAFNSNEALLRIIDTTIENIQGFIANKVINIISK